MGYGFPGGFLFQEDDNQGSKGRGHHQKSIINISLQLSQKLHVLFISCYKVQVNHFKYRIGWKKKISIKMQFLLTANTLLLDLPFESVGENLVYFI